MPCIWLWHAPSQFGKYGILLLSYLVKTHNKTQSLNCLLKRNNSADKTLFIYTRKLKLRRNIYKFRKTTSYV